MLDLAPATTTMAELVVAIPDDALDRPTPCPDYTVGDLVHHVGGLALAFTAAAIKDIPRTGTQGASADASQLPADWRTVIPHDLAELAAAWRDPAAWTGLTAAGGVDLPGEVAGLVALNELVIHGWDLARGSGQLYRPAEQALWASHEFVRQFSGPGHEAEREGLFGPEVVVPDDSALLDRVVAMSGRDPAWGRS